MRIPDRSSPPRHDTLREGIRLGLVVVTVTWLWLAVVDGIAGEPLHTFTVLGGIGMFTMAHYLFNLMYGVLIVASIHGAAREPGLIGVIVTGWAIVESGFVMVTILLSHAGLGNLAWIRILGGSLIGVALAIVTLMRRHPVLTLWRQAREMERDPGP